MAAKIQVDRNWNGGVEITFTDNNGFYANEYLTDAQKEELIAKLQGTWAAEDEARLEFAKLTTLQVSEVACLDGDTRRRELARVELESREQIIKDRSAAKYDYRHQAYVVNGRYVACNHGNPCDCYGTIHAGQPVAANADVH